MLAARAARVRAAVVVIALALPLGLASGAAAADPGAWADDVCSAAATWAAGVERAAGVASTADDSTPARVKASVTKLLKSALKATRLFSEEVDAAGSPSVRDAKKIVGTFQAGIDDVGAALRSARTTIKAAPTTDADAFAAETAEALTAFDGALEEAQSVMGTSALLSSKKLTRAFEESQACQAIVNPPTGAE